MEHDFLVDLMLHEWPSRDHFREAVFRDRAHKNYYQIETQPGPVPGVFTVVCRAWGDVITLGCAESDFQNERDLHEWVLLALDDIMGEMEQADWDEGVTER